MPSEQYFSFDPDQLEIGDVLLTTDPLGKSSAFIRSATGGPFSHAAIYVAYNLFVEAQPRGVTRYHARRVEVCDKDTVRLLRLNPGLDGDRSIRKRAAAEAERLLNRAYNQADMLTALAAGIPASDDGASVFCSQLVARAYAVAGLALVASAPAKTNPNSFLTSTRLRDVTSSALQPVTKRLWSGREPRLSDRERDVHRAVLRDPLVRKSLRALKHNVPPDFYELAHGILLRTRDGALDLAIAQALSKHDFERIPAEFAALYPNLDREMMAAVIAIEDWDPDRLERERSDLTKDRRTLMETKEINERDVRDYELARRHWPASRTFKILERTYRLNMQHVAQTINELDGVLALLTERLTAG